MEHITLRYDAFVIVIMVVFIIGAVIGAIFKWLFEREL